MNLHSDIKTDWKWWQIVGWWELMRIPYNIVLILSVTLTQILIPKFVEIPIGEDVVEPFVIIFFGFIANIFYTFGWIFNLKFRFKNFNIRLFLIGTSFTIFVSLLPVLLHIFFYLKRNLFA